MELNQSHHIFLQKLLNGKLANSEVIKQLMEAIIQLYPNEFGLLEEDTQDSNIERLFPPFLNKINSHLFLLDLEIRKGIDQTNGDLFYHLINLNPDEFSLTATNYTPLELNYLKNLIESIITQNNDEYCIKMSAALRDVPSHSNNSQPEPSQDQVPQTSLGNLTKLEREQLIDRFVQDEWLWTIEGTGLLTLSDKCLNELRDKLINDFSDDIYQCKLCMNLVTQGYLCRSNNCNTYYHHPCLDKLSKDIGTSSSSLSKTYQIKCLNCQYGLDCKLIGNENLIQYDPIYINVDYTQNTQN